MTLFYDFVLKYKMFANGKIPVISGCGIIIGMLIKRYCKGLLLLLVVVNVVIH